MPAVLAGFDPTLLLVLNLAGTFVFGLSGGLAGVRAKLDVFGVVVLAVVVGLAGGITRDLLIGIPPQTFRDWRYLAVAGGAGLVTFLAHAALKRLRRPILVLDAAGLALFCVTGAATALDHRVGPVEAVVLGAVTGVGGGVLRDVLVREIPVVLRTGLYAIPALGGAAVVVASEAGTHNLAFPILGAAVCFAVRLAGVHFDLNVPTASAPDDLARAGPGGGCGGDGGHHHHRGEVADLVLDCIPPPSAARRATREESHMSDTCTHLDAVVMDVIPSSDGCEDCLRINGRWVHLRLCMHCGHVGCCDNSPNRHATAHWHAHADHPVIRSYEPGEDWWWCYADGLFFEVDSAPPAPSRP